MMDILRDFPESHQYPEAVLVTKISNKMGNGQYWALRLAQEFATGFKKIDEGVTMYILRS